VVGWYLNVPASVLSLSAAAIAGSRAGRKGSAFTFWPWGVTALLVAGLLLIAWAGVRLQYLQVKASQMAIRLEAMPSYQSHLPELNARAQRPWNSHVLVINDGPGGLFRATVDGHLQGIENDTYGQGTTIAWEGTRDHERHLAHGESANLRFVYSYAAAGSRFLRLWVPPSPHSGPGGEYLIGSELGVMTDIVRFPLRIVDVTHDTSVVKSVAISVANSGRSVTRVS
jgi:hypothetical protein